MCDTLELWVCCERGWVCRAEPSGSIGTAHAHAEKHAPGTVLGFELPTTWWLTADPTVLDRYVDKKTVKLCSDDD